MSRPSRLVAAMVMLSMAGLRPGPLSADVPLPASMTNPQSAVEAWNVIRLATANVAKLLQELRLTEVTVQASLCSPALRTLAAQVPSAEQRPKVAELTVRAARFLTEIAQACAAQSAEDARRAFRDLQDTLAELQPFFDPKTVAGNVFFCPMHPDVFAENPETRCSKCSMSLVARRIPYSFIYVPPGEPSMILTAASQTPLVPGQKADIKIQLKTRDGQPVGHRDLMVMHTQPIHLLIVDSSLEDYHHEHPLPIEFKQSLANYDPAKSGMCGPLPRSSGEYLFSFTPKRPGPYRIIADLVPVTTGIQEFVSTTIAGTDAGSPLQDKTDRFESTVDGMTFKLAFVDERGARPRPRQVRAMQITVSGADGKPVQQLEPLMQAFAHLVGFYDDGKTVVHLHPEGGDVVRQDVRGGPFLNFRFYPPKSGFIRLYCQIQMESRMIFAPFNVNVAD